MPTSWPVEIYRAPIGGALSGAYRANACIGHPLNLSGESYRANSSPVGGMPSGVIVCLSGQPVYRAQSSQKQPEPVKSGLDVIGQTSLSGNQESIGLRDLSVIHRGKRSIGLIGEMVLSGKGLQSIGGSIVSGQAPRKQRN